MAEILLAASAEMTEAAAWYDERVSGLGERFLVEAEAAFARIDETPLEGRPGRIVVAGSSPANVPTLLPLLGGLHPRAEGRHRCGSASRQRPGYWVKRLGEI